ncbi:MAG: pyruvate formate lyase family protein [Pseudomonadota bacterium]
MLAATVQKAGLDSRVGRLRQVIIEAPQEVCIERARLLTRAMAAHWEKPAVTRMSLALEHVLQHMAVIIRDEELIVGVRTSKLKGAPLFPENKSRWLEGDAANFDRRVVQRALITAEEKKELIDDILPFWSGRTVEEYFETMLPADVSEDMDKYIFTFMLEITYGVGHFTMNHSRVLAQGLSGLIAEAGARFESLGEQERAGEKGQFYQAVIRSLAAAVGLARRYSALARDLAAREPDPARARELEKIARVCARVPEFPAATFHEAVQAVYFIHLIAQIESGGNSVSLGRLDSILRPYYLRDLNKGLTSPGEARELISLLFIKLNEIWNVLEEAYIPGGEGTEGKTTQNVTIGGLGRDGEDETDEFSGLVLDAYADIQTVQPNVSVRFSSRTPREFWEKAAGYVKEGVLLHFMNDEAAIPTLVQGGHALEDARDYGVVGCLEPNCQGKTFGSTFAVQFNGLKCLELALSNGVDNIFGYDSGLKTGPPAGFETFEEVWNAYDRQVRHFTNQFITGITCLDRAIAEMVPSPFASAMIDGTLEKGLDLTRGGARYNSTGVQFMGFSNTADSLYSLKKKVFEEKACTMDEVYEWLAGDWQDAEDKRLCFRRKVPKYGNDHDEADLMAARTADHFCDVLAGRKNFRGGEFWPGIFSVGFHLAMGAFTGASLDGRLAGEMLGNGVTPSNGAAMSGPTAVMNSVVKLPLTRVFNGANLNMRLPGFRLRTENLVNLIKAYFAKGGFQVQFNTVDSEVLRRAQRDPELYRDLIVRVSGYSALFTGLSELAQGEIIERMEYEV